MSFEIQRARVPQYNDTPNLIQASRTFNVGFPILDKASDYTVVIESAAIDLSAAPLDTKPSYEIMIFCDIKPPSVIPAGLVFGPNYFKLTDPLLSVDQFVKWLQDTLLKKAQPYNLGLFQLTGDDFFSYSLQPSDNTMSFTSGDFVVYFNSPMVPIMNGFVDRENPIQAAGQLFYPMTPAAGTTTSTVDTMYRLNKIESILIYTTLPMTQINILSNSRNLVSKEKILGTIELNSLQYNVRTKSDWRYLPDVYRHYTMSDDGELGIFDVWVVISYINGGTFVHMLNPGERFNVNLAFFPRPGVAVE